MNAHSSNWICDGQSEINPPDTNCHSTLPPASYTFMNSVHVTQNPFTGQYVGLVEGGARDGGFDSKVGDNLGTFLMQGSQGGTHTLRKTSIETPGLENEHWVSYSTLWDINLNALYAFVGMFDTGNLAQTPTNFFFVGESSDGVSNFFWHQIFASYRPGGQGTGSQHLFNKFNFVQDPVSPSRWIGLISWSYNDGTTNSSGTTPAYVNYSTRRFGMQFETKGWCHFDWGQDWTSFNPSAVTCSSGDGIPDSFYAIPGLGKNSMSLAIVDGKALVLQKFNAGQHCADTDTACIDAHAPCPPGQDKTLYRTRRNEAGFDGGHYFTVRELDLSTWDTSSTGSQWNGPRTTILDGGQHAQFHINPTDINPTGDYKNDLKQFSDGAVYLYVSIKHSMCLPESNPPLESWDRFPHKASGTSRVWLRLQY